MNRKKYIRNEWYWMPLVLVAMSVVYFFGIDNVPIFDDALLTDGLLHRDYAVLNELKPRLLSYGSFVWLEEVIGEGIWKQRIVNLIIHTGVVLGLWAFYREILRYIRVERDDAKEQGSLHDTPVLGLGVMFFALNPVSVYAVGYLVQRSILMATLFVVLGLWFFALGLRKKRVIYFVSSFLCYILALFSKEHAMFAALVAIPVFIIIKRPQPRSLFFLGLAVGIVVLMSGGLLWFQYGEIIGQPFDELSKIYLAQLSMLGSGVNENAHILSVLNQMWLFFSYGLYWVFPYSDWMSIDMRPPFPVAYFSFPYVFGALGYVAVMIGGFYLVVKRDDEFALIGLGLLVAALLFATEFLTVWVQDPFVLYRSYIWAIGVPAIIVALFIGLRGQALFLVGLVIGLFLFWQGFDRVLSMANSEAVWSDAINKQSEDPRSVGRWRPYLARGHVYLEQGRLERSLADYEASAKLGDMGMGTFNAGVVHSLSGDYKKSLEAFDSAEAQGYNYPAIHYHRGVALHGVQQFGQALKSFERANNSNLESPLREDVLAHMGKTALMLARPDDADNYLKRALVFDPKHKEARLTLAISYLRQGSARDALAMLNDILIDWPDSKVYYGRALVYMELKNKSLAVADVESAIRLDPKNANLDRLRKQISSMP